MCWDMWRAEWCSASLCDACRCGCAVQETEAVRKRRVGCCGRGGWLLRGGARCRVELRLYTSPPPPPPQGGAANGLHSSPCWPAECPPFIHSIWLASNRSPRLQAACVRHLGGPDHFFLVYVVLLSTISIIPHLLLASFHRTPLPLALHPSFPTFTCHFSCPLLTGHPPHLTCSHSLLHSRYDITFPLTQTCYHTPSTPLLHPSLRWPLKRRAYIPSSYFDQVPCIARYTCSLITASTTTTIIAQQQHRRS